LLAWHLFERIRAGLHACTSDLSRQGNSPECRRPVGHRAMACIARRRCFQRKVKVVVLAPPVAHATATDASAASFGTACRAKSGVATRRMEQGPWAAGLSARLFSLLRCVPNCQCGGARRGAGGTHGSTDRAGRRLWSSGSLRLSAAARRPEITGVGCS